MTMQQKMIAAWTAAIEKHGYDAVIDKNFSNQGTVRAMDGFTTVRFAHFSFQTGYVSGSVDEPHVIGGNGFYVRYNNAAEMAWLAGTFDSLPERGDQ
jgi:hypothetical protein